MQPDTLEFRGLQWRASLQFSNRRMERIFQVENQGRFDMVEKPIAFLIPFKFNELGWCLDDVKGGELDKSMTGKAGRQEAGWCGPAQVRSRSGCEERGVKLTGVRWTDTKEESSSSFETCECRVSFGTSHG